MPTTATGLARRRILLLGDGLWAATALSHLARGHDLLAVVGRAQPTDDSLALAAAALGLTCRRPDDVNDPASLAWIRSLAPDLLIAVSHDQIFSALLELPTTSGTGVLPVLNVHAGHPARHRGRAILCWQLLEGARSIELSAMRVTRGVDAGPVLATEHVVLGESPDYGHALAVVSQAVPRLLNRALAALDAGREEATEPGGQPVYYPRRQAGDEWIDWGSASDSILRLVRALASPNCGARTRLGEEPVVVRLARPCPEFPTQAAGIPGAVIGRKRGLGLLVKTGDGAVWVGGLEDEQGRPLPAGRPRVSERFGDGSLAALEDLRRRVRQLETRLQAMENSHDH